MKLQQIQLKNIHQFANLTLDLSTQEATTVVILGAQNSGKTSLLKHIYLALNWFAHRHKDPRASAIILTDNDIKHDAQTASFAIEVSYPAELGNVASDSLAKARPDYLCRWKWQKSRQNNLTMSISTSELTELDQLITRYQKQVLDDALFSTPCIAYYPVERFIYEVNIQGKNATSTLAPLHNAYDLTAVNFTTFNKFFEWYREVHDVENAQAAKLFKQYLDPQQRFTQSHHFEDALSSIEQAYRLSAQRSISSLRTALQTVLPEVEDIELDYTPKLALTVKHQGKTTAFLQLPQATRIWIGLVGDLVRRLCLLNPQSLYPCLEGEGIVLIDSIELLLDAEHLQHVLPRLKRAFPRLQFIVSSLNTEILDNAEDTQCFQLQDGRLHPLHLHQHQQQLDQLYQNIMSPISETSKMTHAESQPLTPEQLSQHFSQLSTVQQQQLLAEFTQHIQQKEN